MLSDKILFFSREILQGRLLIRKLREMLIVCCCHGRQILGAEIEKGDTNLGRVGAGIGEIDMVDWFGEGT